MDFPLWAHSGNLRQLAQSAAHVGLENIRTAIVLSRMSSFTFHGIYITNKLSSRYDGDNTGCGSFEMLTLCDTVCPV